MPVLVIEDECKQTGEVILSFVPNDTASLGLDAADEGRGDTTYTGEPDDDQATEKRGIDDLRIWIGRAQITTSLLDMLVRPSVFSCCVTMTGPTR